MGHFAAVRVIYDIQLFMYVITMKSSSYKQVLCVSDDIT